MTKADVRNYLKFVALASAALCAIYYLVFTVAMLASPDAGSLKDRATVALTYVFITPMTLAGSWYLTIPAVLVIGTLLFWAWPKLPTRLTNWRPNRVWQHILVGVAIIYGGLSVVVLAFCTVFAIPGTFAGTG